MATALIVEHFNETLPPLTNTYNTQTFPWRYYWKLGISAQLFFMIAEYYRKNNLDYQAGGVAVNDLNKARDYDAAGIQRWQDYLTWEKGKKVQLNMDEAWGEVASPYAYGNGTWNQY